MSLSTKDFFIGLITGVVLSFLIVGGLIGGLIYFSFKMTEELRNSEVSLPTPKFPEASRMALYGKADWDWSFRTLDDKPAKLGDAQGKVVFVNFWATWCGPCVSEMPNIQKLHDALQNDPVAFVLLSDEEAPTVRKFVEEKKYTFPVYLYRGSPPEVFRTAGVPATYILNPDGFIVFKDVGAGKWDDESCIKFIRGLLPPAPAAPAPKASPTPVRPPAP